MAQLIKHRAVAVDSWTTLEIGADETPETIALPTGDVIFPLAVWQARRDEIISCHKRIGLLLQAGERVEDVAADEMPDVVDKIIKVYVENRHPDERFLDTLDRIGMDPFKNRVYEGRAHGKARTAQMEAA